MRRRPLVICLDRSDELLYRGVEVIALPDEDVIEMSELGWRLIPVAVAYDNGNDALSVLDSRFDLFPTDFGFDGIGTDQKEKDIRLFDSLFNLPPPVHRGRDALPVDPEIQLAFLQLGGKTFCKWNIFTRVGNKDFRHVKLHALG